MGRLWHEFGPFYDEDSEILILGSFPSAKSREAAFYYAHPQNRFWRVLASCFDDDTPVTIDEKRRFLSRHRIALWDVIDSCEISGSSDASIRDVVPTDIEWLCRETSIRRVVLNGRTAERYFHKFHSDFQLPTASAPSTSPANAAWSAEKLAGAWREAIFS